MKTQRKAFLHSAALDENGYPKESPFNTSRAGRTRRTLLSMGLLKGDDRHEVEPQALTRAELEAFHSPDYLDALLAAGQGRLSPDRALEYNLGTPDCPIFKDMYGYVALAAGATVTGARLILKGEADSAFNPSGGLHHAQRSQAAGFCFINDVVLAAMELAGAGRKVLFLDLDAHHCDAVQEAFYHRRDVMTVSLHESGKTLFPGTGFEDEIGAGEGEGYTVNIPLPVGTYDAAYEKAFMQVALPLMRAYDPDVILMELGMDGLAGDPLAHLHLTNNVYADLVARVVALGKPMLLTGGGGYNLRNTVRGWALAWSVLCGDEPHDMTMGMGGVMLENTDWVGGLRDRVLLSDAGLHSQVNEEVLATIEKVRSKVFPFHGL